MRQKSLHWDGDSVDRFVADKKVLAPTACSGIALARLVVDEYNRDSIFKLGNVVLDKWWPFVFAVYANIIVDDAYEISDDRNGGDDSYALDDKLTFDKGMVQHCADSLTLAAVFSFGWIPKVILSILTGDVIAALRMVGL